MRNPTALGSFNPTQQRAGSRAIQKPCAYWPSKSSMRIPKPFRMISLRKMRQQPPWIDILTKNTGGWGYIPFSIPPTLANTAAVGAGSKPFAAGPPGLLKTARIRVCPLRRAFYAWDRISGAGVGALVFTAPSAVLESYLILHRLKPVLLKTVRVKVWPLRRPFYAWDRISGAGVGAVIFTAPSAVLESYLILHRLKPVLPKTVRVRVWPLRRPFYAWDRISAVEGANQRLGHPS
jgi:hypothetical protein